jgi:hypothetical protein
MAHKGYPGKSRKGNGQLRKANDRIHQYNARGNRNVPRAKTVTGPCPRGKRQYGDRSAAKLALATIAIEREQQLRDTGTTNHHEKRWYRCDVCPWIHLSSKDERWWAVDVAHELWPAALPQAANERRTVIAQANAMPIPNEVTHVAEPSTDQRDWAVAA